MVIAARKTPRWVDELKAAEGKPSPRTDADGQCEFRYPPAGGEKAYRFVALGDVKKKGEPGQAEPYQRLETRDYRYRVFVTHLADKSPFQMGITKMCLNRALDADTQTLMVMERLAVGVTLNSHDAAEGVAAFLEKRDPVWTGT